MKPSLMKYLIIAAVLILFGSGAVWAGGPGHHSRPPGGSHYQGNYHKHHGGGYRHYGPSYHRHHYYDHGPRYRYYYGPPRYYYNPYYPGGWGGYDGAYYFSGGISEPGFGFVFGTRGNW